MRAPAYLPLLAVLASAGPLHPRQDIDFAALKAAPNPVLVTVTANAPQTTVHYDLAAATDNALSAVLNQKRDLGAEANILKRADCDPEPPANGPTVSPDTPEDFVAYDAFKQSAQNAVTPDGYQQTFSNLQASNSAYGYMGYTELSSYDVAGCASKCDGIVGCSGINILFERNPSITPGNACQNPNSVTRIKCVFWGGYVAAENANNNGQWRNQFHVVIAGSNGYMKTSVPTVPGYTGNSLGNAAINAPLNLNGEDTYLGVKVLTQSYFDPNLCAAACTQISVYNVAHPPGDGSAPKTCQFFTTYLAATNGVPQGQVCAFYKEGWDKSYATNVGQYQGNDHVTIGYAFSYWNTANPGFPALPQKK